MTHDQDWTTSEINEMLDDYRPVTIPVNISVEGRQKVLSLDEARAILKAAALISLERCSCREKIGGCDAPLDVCVCTDEEAEEALAEREAWKTTLDAAMDALHRGHRAGLVHLAFEAKANGKIQIICSCCACCCSTMAAITRFGYNRDLIGHSDVIAVHDADLCTGCGLCAERCHFKAWTADGDWVTLNQERCSGCGVCVSFCPEGAIRLVKRQ